MNLTLEIGSLEGFSQSLLQWAESLRQPVQSAMAARLQDITQSNFGAGDGEDRPAPWQPLSQGYAKAAHAGDTTPTEILSGDMRDSIHVDDDSAEFARVFTDLEYAPEQQWGGGEWNTPARPFFPLIGDESSAVLTEHSASEIRLAAEQAIADHLNQ